jgi:hypothetical protein
MASAKVVKALVMSASSIVAVGAGMTAGSGAVVV